MLRRIRTSVGMIIHALIIGRVLTGEAVGAEATCTKFDAATEAIFANASKAGAFITTVPPSAMTRFTKLMASRGVELSGDAAFVWIGPIPGATGDVFAIYVKRGKMLCLGGSISLEKTKEGGKHQPSTPQAEWF